MRIKRLVVLGCGGIFLILVAVAYLYFWQSLPMGSGPAGPAVQPDPFSHTWSDEKVLLVGIGDSVTAGFGARRSYSYFDRLVTNPPDEFENMKGKCLRAVLPHLQATNLAVSGSTSGQHLSDQLPRLPNVGSDVIGLVVMTTGGNDLIHNYGLTPPREQAAFGATWEEAAPWVTNYSQRLNQMIEEIHRHFPRGCHIFLANIFDPTDGIGDLEHAGLPAWKDSLKILAAYNDVIHGCAERHSFVHIVNLHSAFLGHGIHCTQFWSKHYDAKDPHYWYFVNLEDPNERGYDVVRRLFLREISKVSQGLH